MDVLQRVAIFCTVLRCHSILQPGCIAVCCSVLQCVAVGCSVVQCVSVCCSVVQWVFSVLHRHSISQPGCVAACCIVLQCIAVCCSVLQCVAILVLQCLFTMRFYFLPCVAMSLICSLNALQCVAIFYCDAMSLNFAAWMCDSLLQYVVWFCLDVLQCAAV